METLLTPSEVRQVLGLRSTHNLNRFAKRYGIPLVRFGGRMVRIRASDLARVIDSHLEEAKTLEA